MIPNKTNTENSRNNFVQLRLGEIENQKEDVISKIVEKPKRKSQELAELVGKNSEILSKYRKFLCREYRKESTTVNNSRIFPTFNN
ncbi:hypothetical protein KJA15_03545 [Patescibacteria group bacterium]|nr:hypothetical protein [Patescibacteria group bacterium]